MVKTMQEINYQYYMDADLSEFSGEWIAICEDKIIAHGKDIKIVVEHANRVSGGRKFLLARAPSEETMIF